MKNQSFFLNEEAYEILDDYKKYGFRTKNEFIKSAINKLILQENYNYLTSTIIDTFTKSFKDTMSDTIKAWQNLLNSSNIAILKHKSVFINDLLQLKKSNKTIEERLHKYIQDAKEEINVDRSTIKELIEVFLNESK